MKTSGVSNYSLWDLPASPMSIPTPQEDFSEVEGLKNRVANLEQRLEDLEEEVAIIINKM